MSSRKTKFKSKIDFLEHQTYQHLPINSDEVRFVDKEIAKIFKCQIHEISSLTNQINERILKRALKFNQKILGYWTCHGKKFGVWYLLTGHKALIASHIADVKKVCSVDLTSLRRTKGLVHIKNISPKLYKEAMCKIAAAEDRVQHTVSSLKSLSLFTPELEKEIHLYFNGFRKEVVKLLQVDEEK